MKKAKKLKLNINHARRVLEVVDAGLVSGVGDPTPGKMCVEAAVCYALGMEHGDNPICVGAAVRSFKINLNDASWSTPKARAKGMRQVAIAQLGSNEIDQKAFAKELVLGTVKRVIPLALRAAASVIPSHKEQLEAAALVCEAVLTLAEARAASDAASYAASYAASDAASDAARAASYTASDAARAASYAASDAASYAASAASYAASAASYAASAASYAASAASDNILSVAADVAVQALRKCKAQGVKWLKLAA